MFDLGLVLTLYPPPRSLTAAPRTRQAGVSAVSAAPATVLTCPARSTEPTEPPNDTHRQDPKDEAS